MKYKLINNKTKEECICDKVTIDGFDYYVNDETIKEDYWYLCWSIINNINSNHQIRKANNTEPVDMYSWASNYKKVIATNNPNIDIPKVIDEVERLAKISSIKYKRNDKLDDLILGVSENSFVEGYNKSQETHPFSEEDMIKFSDWCSKNYVYEIGYDRWILNRVHYTTKELLKLWKEQRNKTLYYE